MLLPLTYTAMIFIYPDWKWSAVEMPVFFWFEHNFNSHTLSCHNPHIHDHVDSWCFLCACGVKSKENCTIHQKAHSRLVDYLQWLGSDFWKDTLLMPFFSKCAVYFLALSAAQAKSHLGSLHLRLTFPLLIKIFQTGQPVLKQSRWMNSA